MAWLLSLEGRFKALPAAVVRIVGTLVAANAVVWAAVAVVLHYYPAQIGPAVLAYTLGLRHALDADHISAIDLMTRRLVAAGQRPVTVGTFFSLGHSTIVVVTCVVVAATSGALRDRFDGFQYVGGIVGTSVSAAFLVLLCLGNGWVLHRLVRRLRALLREPDPHHPRADADADADADPARGEDHAVANLQLEGAGFLANVFRKLFRIVDRPWKMYPLGVLFGLGFDTSSEIALLGIASLQGAQGTSLWIILIFPLLFTAGMCMLDTTDGALMMALYTSKAFARDAVAVLYYSIVLTAITVTVSAFIGVIQILSLVQNVAEPEGPFWDGLDAIAEHYDIVGAAICGLFLLVGVGSALAYGPWRRRADARRRRRLGLGAETGTGTRLRQEEEEGGDRSGIEGPVPGRSQSDDTQTRYRDIVD
ncbi:Ni2+/Co2+ transporter transition metal uptake transporter [Durotheca rogersii]|uniref:Ni2+/Co2+ transporter transition metal uptake transporter n=1 Tax=Durotheca rogersii TaxID=419775 RepID=UPI00221E594C|nr:Ni2+/Co2+ transporter transition metal uptake transporter [Durotheca rogersii]KAI5868170.1 Ni2+/Co2+ transporter transition metal uptake transporter [Durotheca rogersii]